MAHYHDENDLKLLRDMKAAAPTEFQACLRNPASSTLRIITILDLVRELSIN